MRIALNSATFFLGVKTTVSVCPSGVHVYVNVRCEMIDLELSTKLMADSEYDKFGVILFCGC